LLGLKADEQVYESPDDAKEAITHLNGFNFSGRYIVGKSSNALGSRLEGWQLAREMS